MWHIALLTAALLLYSSKNGNWRRPVNYLRKTSGFGLRWGKPHKGIDIVSRSGDKTIKAVTPGTVIYAAPLGAMGNTVLIHHPKESPEKISLYGHLDSIRVRCNQKVEAGSNIGEMGNTGNSRGTHLHFGVLEEKSGGWVYINPEIVLNQNNSDRSVIDKLLGALPGYLGRTYTTRVPINSFLDGDCRQENRTSGAPAAKKSNKKLKVREKNIKKGKNNLPKLKKKTNTNYPQRVSRSRSEERR